jgi:hypothetical protein
VPSPAACVMARRSFEPWVSGHPTWTAPPNGGFRALGHSMRDGILARGHVPARLPGNRRAAVEDLIEADLVAAQVRTIMANRLTWTGSASDLLRAGGESRADALSDGGTGWPKNPRALAGRLRRAQPTAFLKSPYSSRSKSPTESLSSTTPPAYTAGTRKRTRADERTWSDGLRC